MYSILIALHSLFRWFVLISLLYAIFLAYRGWFSEKPFTSRDNIIRNVTTILAHIQLLIGIGLYFISPIMDHFMHNFKEAVHQSDVRFFGMEHSILMLIAIIVITIGSSMAKRKPTDKSKFKTMAIWFTIALIIILIAIPWPFSPMASRPYFRAF